MLQVYKGVNKPFDHGILTRWQPLIPIYSRIEISNYIFICVLTLILMVQVPKGDDGVRSLRVPALIQLITIYFRVKVTRCVYSRRYISPYDSWPKRLLTRLLITTFSCVEAPRSVYVRQDKLILIVEENKGKNRGFGLLLNAALKLLCVSSFWSLW